MVVTITLITISVIKDSELGGEMETNIVRGFESLRFISYNIQYFLIQLNHFVCQCGAGFFQHAHQDRMTPGC